MGSGGFTIASQLNVFVEIYQAAAVVVKLIKIFRDHGPREGCSKCRFAFLIENGESPDYERNLPRAWGMNRISGKGHAELPSR
jgi:sulfite reductase beta subunit-like hemoprotein